MHILSPCPPSFFPPVEGASRTDGRFQLIEKDIEHMAKGEGLVMHFNSILIKDICIYCHVYLSTLVVFG